MQKTAYQEQTKLSFFQFLSELPNFICILVSLILSSSLLVFVDMLDSCGYLLRFGMVALLAKKLTKDLRYEYNYGVGKIEAISSMLCDGLLFLGFLITIGLSVYSIVKPSQPSDLLIVAVGIKAIAVTVDTIFYTKQRKIAKSHQSSIAITNEAAAKAALLSDCATLVSLLLVWLVRNSQIGLYVSPIISCILSLYLMTGCVKRIKSALVELTDKTLPEEMQMKILNTLTKYYDAYSQFHSINSHKNGDIVKVDIHLSFENSTLIKDVVQVNKKMQEELEKEIGNCIVNIVLEDDK